MSDIRYPIGHFTPDRESSEATRRAHVDALEALPAQLRTAVSGLRESQLDTPYREGGWTVRELLHHIADSHMNAYIRCKLTLTEELPTVKPYSEGDWARLPDSRLAPTELSLSLLEALQRRWVILLRALDAADFDRRFNHPENGGHDLNWLIALYDWHGRHHTAHITALRERMGW